MNAEFDNKKILITFLMHLGDLVLTTPFIHALREAVPNAHLSFLCDEKLKDVVLHNPYLDEVLTIDRYGRDNSLLKLWGCASGLSANNYDVLINLHPNERCSFVAALTKTKLRAGSTHPLFKFFWDKVTPLNRKLHAADMYLDVLHQLGLKYTGNYGLEMYVGDADRESVTQFWQSHQVGDFDKIIGFNIGSAVITKRWDPKRFAAVADYFSFHDYRVIFFGGNVDRDLVAETVEKMQKKPLVATGMFTIGELAAAMGRCSLIITNDSGPMHVAISQKVPIVALYGPSHTDLYGPYKADATVVRSNPVCDGCKSGMKHQCSDMQCMRNLTVEQVIRAAEVKLTEKMM